jgi:TolB-like protein
LILKIQTSVLRLNYIALAALACVVILASPGFSKETKKVAVLPFVINTQEDLNFLKKGIFDMLSSRISYMDEVEVLTREDLENRLKDSAPELSMAQGVNEPIAKKIGAYLDVDYVLFGSLTLFGNSMSLDVNMIDSKNNTPALTFFRQANEMGAVIPELDEITAEINYKVFGRETHAFKPQQSAQQDVLRRQQGPVTPLGQFETLLTVNGALNGMAIGDLDGDKKNEIVVIYDRTIEIFKTLANGRLQSVQKIQEDVPIMKLIGVDVADINHNGRSEIFITRFSSSSKQVKSFVIEYNETRYVKGNETFPWYLRVVKDAKGSEALYGQLTGKEGPYVPKKVFKVEWNNQTYAQGMTVKTPGEFSIMSLTSGDVLNKDATNFVFTDQKGRLVIFNESGRKIWESDEGYGGSKLYYRFPKVVHEFTEANFNYFQPRNLVFDLGGDGKTELFVIQNKEDSNYLFPSNRSFKKGSIDIFSMNEMGLTPDAHLPKRVPGQITCIDIGDHDNDGTVEFLVAMIKKSGSILTSEPKSMLIAYELIQNDLK